jgi:competence protein ComEA
VELTRPVVPDTNSQKIGRLLSGITPTRVLSTAGALLVVSIGSWWLLRSPAPPIERSLPMAARAATSVGLVPPPSVAPAEVVVQIAGAVQHPGVYHLPTGGRVADLIAAAGGPVEGVDPAVLALAAKVSDGQRVYLAMPGEPGSSAMAAGAASGAATGPLDLNAATLEQLDALPGVGPATAAAIVAYPDKHGAFRSVDDLLQIKGLGASKVDALRSLVRA